MESVKSAIIFEEAREEYEQESLLSLRSAMHKEILQSENWPAPLFRGLIFALPVSLLMWGIIIWVIL